MMDAQQTKETVMQHFKDLGRNKRAKNDMQTQKDTPATEETATQDTTPQQEADRSRRNTDRTERHTKGKETDQIEICEPVTENEVTTCIRSMKNGKATPEDDIPNEFLKKGGPTLAKALVRYF
jgi:hypothetical protein